MCLICKFITWIDKVRTIFGEGEYLSNMKKVFISAQINLILYDSFQKINFLF